MTDLRYFLVDAFVTPWPWSGNPAAVVPLGDGGWLPDATMQAIAAELNLSETAFFASDGDGGLHIRWFTPKVEVDLCGHATLASAFVVTNVLAPSRREVQFRSKSGPLAVRRDGARLVLDFPARPPGPVDDPTLRDRLGDALGAVPDEVLVSRDLVAIYPHATKVRGLRPDFAKLLALDVHGVIATAPGNEPTSLVEGDADVDFVSRFFAPREGVPEDPVTGSAHCTLIPLWAERLGTSELYARQVSARSGYLACRLRGDRVDIGGEARLVASGTLHL